MTVPWLAAFGEQQASPLYHLEPLPDYEVPKYSAGSAAFVIEDSDDEAEVDPGSTGVYADTN